MRYGLLIYSLIRHVSSAIVAIAVSSPYAQMVGLKWDRDTIVEKEFQTSFCHGKPERASICSDAISIAQSSSQQVVIDSIFFKVTTPGIVSSHATLKYGQTVLKFAYHQSGVQADYPWKFSEYNDSGFSKISITPFQKAEFSGFEIDNCLFSCPLSPSVPSAKLQVTAVLIFLSKNQRDTLTLMGLLNQSSTPLRRHPKTGADNDPIKTSELRNINGRAPRQSPWRDCTLPKEDATFLFSK